MFSARRGVGGGGEGDGVGRSSTVDHFNHSLTRTHSLTHSLTHTSKNCTLGSRDDVIRGPGCITRLGLRETTEMRTGCGARSGSAVMLKETAGRQEGISYH